MRRWTLLEIKNKIKRDLDLEDEDFIQDEEMIEYINEGIDMCEAQIHNICEDYFLTEAAFPIVTGTQLYDLPTDIYGMKVRGLIYNNGTTIFPVKRVRELNKFIKAAVQNQFPAALDYSYMLVNSSGADPQIKLIPAAQETSSNMTIWYLRNATELAVDADECDIPEFVYYVIQYAKVRCYEKEVGHPNSESAKAELARLEKLMLDTLSEMVPDGDNEVEKDLSIYEEMN